MELRIMKKSRALMVGTTALFATLIAPAGVGGAQGPPAAPTPPARVQLHAQTLSNLLAALKGEAYAYAKYNAYGQVSSGTLALLFNSTANKELSDHFAAFADAYGLAGSNAANLSVVFAGEDYETTTMYPTFAARAKAAGDTKAAQLFSEIARDEASHRDLFRQALTAITGSGSAPAGPIVHVAPLTRETAQVKTQTRQDLLTAVHGEAFAHALYLTYAQAAQAQGLANLAKLFQRTATVELREHFAAEANLAGLVGTDRSNLISAVAGETNEANVLYPNAARQAYAVGERPYVGNLFMRTANQETRHVTHFTAALVGSCDCPCPYRTCPWQS